MSQKHSPIAQCTIHQRKMEQKRKKNSRTRKIYDFYYLKLVSFCCGASSTFSFFHCSNLIEIGKGLASIHPSFYSLEFSFSFSFENHLNVFISFSINFNVFDSSPHIHRRRIRQGINSVMKKRKIYVFHELSITHHITFHSVHHKWEIHSTRQVVQNLISILGGDIYHEL